MGTSPSGGLVVADGDLVHFDRIPVTVHDLVRRDADFDILSVAGCDDLVGEFRRQVSQDRLGIRARDLDGAVELDCAESASEAVTSPVTAAACPP
ncbi:MAG: hypothetical protein EOR84_23930 [Mesorhizobium sp.]|uniref:hypothetical protein n=1 Tax=Mesorhizobium sp. TaxID=1871066 RepID=UPI000FE58926|nr:hypothetical protein [Mesorhizobium sp.]RWM89505.1 MAG: hypothetical protein EOR84_23930 [Mesorhizobium sp.]